MDMLTDKRWEQRTSSTICYLTAIAIIAAAIVLGELLWLPATIKLASGIQWIEMIDWLLYGLIIVPILMITGAVMRIVRQRNIVLTVMREGRIMGRVWLGWLLQLLRLAIIVTSMAGAVELLRSPDRFVLIAALISVAALLVFFDLLLSEMVLWSGERRSRFPKRSGTALLVTAIVFVILLCPTGYLVTYPGMTLNMNRYAHVESGEIGGEINGVLVFDRPAFLADWLYGRLLPMYEFEPTPENEPPLSETYTQVVAMKTDANSVAAAIAMQKAGVGEGIIAEGVRVVAVLKDGAAAHRLQAGDVIIELDDQPIVRVSDMTSIMSERIKPGTEVKVRLLRGDEELTLLIPTGEAKDEALEAPKRAVFGISVQTAVRMDIPLSIDYSRYIAHVGGPSHGAMLTLAIIDQLTPGGVTGGIRVAGTGTIESDGSVGLVGGVPQKAYAVSRTDADVFFVPAELEQEARAGAPELNIVPVHTIDDILHWLEQYR